MNLTSINPSDGSTVWSGPVAGPDDVRDAIDASRKAFPAWRDLSMEERAGILRRFARIVRERSSELAHLIAREIGKPIREAETEVKAVTGKVEISIRAQSERCREFTGGTAVTRFRPHGVLAVMGPYNFPAHLPNGHICPALLAGNTVIFKPSELSPATGSCLVDCWNEAGLPEGILQVLQGGPETAIALTREQGIDGVLFTGSAATGKRLARLFADSPGKILALEMGGNNPLIIDTPHLESLQTAVETSLASAFISTGQRCTCARRLIVIDSTRSGKFLADLVEGATSLRIDEPFGDPEPFMGPLASPLFPSRVIDRQLTLIKACAHPLLEARALREGTGFISPGILDVTGVVDLPDEEIFGPLLQVIRVPDLEAAIEAANRTRFGLAAGILTERKERYDLAYRSLKAGIINWNSQLTGASSAAPFGGIGDSGNLRPSAYFAADYCSYPVASIERPQLD
ncbi:MAG: succinylglutamate-semialdehyde dehydrogenase [Opitutales bacterium]|jgi:succinylglutamic semialdehyde dehydrogenase